jgi:hypothetical protein
MQTKAARTHNRQSVRPLLQIRTVRAGYRDDVARLEVINAGIGPTSVTRTIRYEFLYGGEDFVARSVLL